MFVCLNRSIHNSVEGWWWLSAEAEADAKDEAKLMEPSASHVKSLKKKKKKNDLQKPDTSAATRWAWLKRLCSQECLLFVA